MKELVLTDHGGFSKLSRPGPDLTIFVYGQGDLDLKERTHKAAWLNNFLSLAYFNATGPDPTNIISPWNDFHEQLLTRE